VRIPIQPGRNVPIFPASLLRLLCKLLIAFHALDRWPYSQLAWDLCPLVRGLSLSKELQVDIFNRCPLLITDYMHLLASDESWSPIQALVAYASLMAEKFYYHRLGWRMSKRMQHTGTSCSGARP
jgi:hypothetical protein